MRSRCTVSLTLRTHFRFVNVLRCALSTSRLRRAALRAGCRRGAAPLPPADGAAATGGAQKLLMASVEYAMMKITHSRACNTGRVRTRCSDEAWQLCSKSSGLKEIGRSALGTRFNCKRHTPAGNVADDPGYLSTSSAVQTAVPTDYY